MRGGHLVLLDSRGHPKKKFPVLDGVTTLGRDPTNDIRITLPSVASFHATVVVESDKTLVSAVEGTTLVNGRAVSTAVLRHGDVITVAERALRWDYTEPNRSGPAAVLTTPHPVRASRLTMSRRSAPVSSALRDRALQLAYEMSHRASLPGSTGGKQVAIVQPQRRNASEQTDKSSARASPQTTTRRNTNHELNTSLTEEDKSKRKNSRTSPKSFLQSTTKATLWIESRKTSPRRKVQTPAHAPPARRSLPHKKSTPLRLTVLKKAQSAHKTRVIKIEAPLKIDHTKQHAIMLMTGHTPKSRLKISPKTNSSKKSPSYVVKKPSPVRKTPRGRGRQSGRRSQEAGGIGVTPSKSTTFAQESANRRSSKRSSGAQSVSILEITDSTQDSSTNISTRSGRTPKKSPSLPSPKKSAMKDHSKKGLRRTESIKFDLSNLGGHRDKDVLSLSDTTHSGDHTQDITLHYSESSGHSQSPSPRRSIHSRSSRMLERVGTTLTSTPASPSRTLTPSSPSRTLTSESPSARRSIRGSAMVQRALVTSTASDRTKTILSPNSSAASDRTRTILSTTTSSDRTRTILSTTTSSDRTRTLPSANSSVSDSTRTILSANSTKNASAFRTRTISPRSNHNLESYSVVDLVSFESEDPTKSVYNSADSANSSEFGTPPTTGRTTRSTLGPILGTSTPYVGRTRSTRSKSSSNTTINQRKSTVSTRRSKSLSTPENKHISVNSTKVSRVSRSRSRINDSDLMLLDNTEAEDSSPKTSRRSRATKSATKKKNVSDASLKVHTAGMVTPENRHSPEAAGTPVLSIQSLLNSSRSSVASPSSARRGRSIDYKRKTIGVLSGPRGRSDAKSKSLGPVLGSARRSRLRLSNDSNRTDEGAPQTDNREKVTPRSVVKLTPEAVKNKHSTAKKPLSKRSIIDDLNRSDIVKQLFNSPVKRKLSQSMTEFSRRQLFDDEDVGGKARRPTRRTVAGSGNTPDSSLVEPHSITPERFVSPVETPTNSPNLSGLQRLFKATPVCGSRRGAGDSPRATRSRVSIKNDLTDVRGVKAMFGKSPRNDLRRVSGVHTLFQRTSPKNELTDVRGVRNMFQRKSPKNDLRNVSGVKRTLARTSPHNDLSDVRGVRRMFKRQKPASSYHDVSGVEELFDSSGRADRSELLFDMLVGRPPIKAVYSKTFSAKTVRKPRTRRRSLRHSVEVTPDNVDEWLQQELKRRLPTSASKNVTKELQKLATDTVAGSEPVRGSRTRNGTFNSERSASSIYNASTLPIKKRSLVNSAIERRQLPLKKRAVHSTPMKGRVEVTMNASELGRVSPIAVERHSADVERESFVSRSTQTNDEETETIFPTKTRTPRKQETPKKIEISKPLPEKSPEQPAPRRATRNRKITESSQANTKKRRSSLVVGKKAPVMSPKPATPTAGTSRTRNARVSIVVAKPAPKVKPQPAKKAPAKSQAEKATPKTTRARQSATKAPPASPKLERSRRTRGKASEYIPKTKAKEVEIVKPAPAKRGRNAAVEEVEPPAVKRTRKVKESSVAQTSTTRRGKASKSETTEKQPNSHSDGAKNESVLPEPVAKQPRGRRAQNVTNVEAEVGQKQTNTRGRKAQIQSSVQPEPEAKQSNRRGRKAQIQTNVEPEVVVKQSTRGKRVQANVEPVTEETQSNRRGRKAPSQRNVQPEPEQKQSNVRGRKAQTKTSDQPEPMTRRGQKAKADENQPKTRGNKAGNPPEPTSKGRNAKPDNTVLTETRGRKRKAPANEEVPTKVAKTNPKKGNTSEVSKKSPAKGKRAVSKDNKAQKAESPVKTTRGRVASSKVEKKPVQVEVNPTRGRKAQEAKVNVTSTRQGKKKATVEPSPVKSTRTRRACRM